MKRSLICAVACAIATSPSLFASPVGRVAESKMEIDSAKNPDATYSFFASNHGIRLGKNPYPKYYIEDTLQTKWSYQPVDLTSGKEFKFASFNYWNGKNVDGTAPTTIKVNSFFDFFSWKLPDTTFSIDLLLEDGIGTNSDTFTLPENLISEQTVKVDENVYAVEVTGLQWDGQSEKHNSITTKPSYSNNDFSIIARFITVPEPSTIVFTALGIGAVLYARRSDRNRDRRNS